MSALRSSEVAALRRFQIMGRSNGGSATVRSRGGVRSMEGPSLEVLLYNNSTFSFTCACELTEISI